MSASTALLVIDVQESFRHRPYFTEDEMNAYIVRQQRLIDGAKASGIAIVQIFHVEDEGPFSDASGYVVPFAGLKLEADAVFRKTRHSALAGTPLEIWLRERGIGHLLVSGIRTEQCCETTTRHASDLGFTVDYVSEATHTFAMEGRNGRVWSPDEIRARTELVLDGRFARIVTIDEALADLSAKKAA